MSKKIIALDLEGTLISNAISQIPRPHLFSFLEECKTLSDDIVLFTTVNEKRTRDILNLLINENTIPEWVTGLKYINWKGNKKDLYFICDDINKVFLIDDVKEYIKEEQLEHWIEIKQFESPYSDNDNELIKTLDIIKTKLNT